MKNKEQTQEQNTYNDFFDFDLSLTKIQYSLKNRIHKHVYKVNSFFKFDLRLTKI